MKYKCIRIASDNGQYRAEVWGDEGDLTDAPPTDMNLINGYWWVPVSAENQASIMQLRGAMMRDRLRQIKTLKAEYDALKAMSL